MCGPSGRRSLASVGLFSHVAVVIAAAAQVCAVVLLGFWFIYVIVSSLRYYGKVDDLWSIKGSLAERDVGSGYDKDNMNIFKGRDMCSG